VARPPTPVFFENFSPPKKERREKKKRTSVGGENPNLLLSILHERQAPNKKLPLKKVPAFGSKKRATSLIKGNQSASSRRSSQVA